MLKARHYLAVSFVLSLLVLTSCAPIQPGNDYQPFAFGLIADIQYADKPISGGVYYTLGKLEECVADLNTKDLAFTIQLGDIIDGRYDQDGRNDLAKTREDLDTVLSVYNTLNSRKYHVVGNHCVGAGKQALLEKLEMQTSWYDFSYSCWRFIVLDGTDAGYGAIGSEQLNWLKNKLALAQTNNHKVIIFNHFPLLNAAGAHDVNPEPVLEILRGFDCVKVVFAGHHHGGGYAFRNSIHHITIQAMINGPKQNAYAVVEVFPGRLHIHGVGRVPTRILNIHSPAQNRILSLPNLGSF